MTVLCSWWTWTAGSNKRRIIGVSEAALTSRGAATRGRIVEATADLVLTRGVRATTLDDVRAATGTSKSQLFHYFPQGKADLVRAVVLRQTDRVLDGQRLLLQELDSFAALQRWRDAIVAVQRERDCVGGCPLGSLASEVAEHDDQARTLLASSFGQWQALLARGLRGMRDSGALRSDADPDALALATVASLQGGLLLAQTTRSTSPLEVALDAALAHLRSYAS